MHVIQTRKLNPEDQQIGNDIHTAEDGEAIRSLGACLGNEADNGTPWETILDNKQKLKYVE